MSQTAKSSLDKSTLDALIEHVNKERQALVELRDYWRQTAERVGANKELDPVPFAARPRTEFVTGLSEASPSHVLNDADYVFGLNQLAARIAFTNREKGFGDPSLENIHTKLLLAVSEICEAQEHLRDGKLPDLVYWHRGDGGSATVGPSSSTAGVIPGDKPDGFPIEIADAIIRLLHICNALHIDIAAAIALKVKYNRTRPEKHGRQF
jgi:hypothetical protein